MRSRNPSQKGKSAQVVIIDIDQSDCSHVDTVDIPETSQRKSKRFSEWRPNSKGSAWNIISIDDEDGCVLDSDVTSGRKNHTNEKSQHRFTEESDGEDCQIFNEQSNLPFKRSSSSGKVRPRNRFGLDIDLEVSPSNSDDSDCEVMEGSSGKIREQWEKAASKKKSLEDRTSTSEPCINPQNPQHRKSCKTLDRDTGDARSYSETSVQSNSNEDIVNQANHNVSADNPSSSHDDVYVDTGHNLSAENPSSHHDDGYLDTSHILSADNPSCQHDDVYMDTSHNLAADNPSFLHEDVCMDNQAIDNLFADNPSSQHDDVCMDNQANDNLSADNPSSQQDDIYMDNQSNDNLYADNPSSQHDDVYVDNQGNHTLFTDNPFFQHDDVSAVKGSCQFADHDCQQDENDLVSETRVASNAQAGHEAEFDHDYSSFTYRRKSGPEEHFPTQVEKGPDHLGQRKDVSGGPCSEEVLVSRTGTDHIITIFEEKQDYREDRVVNTNRDDSQELAIREFSHHKDETVEKGSELDLLIGARERLKETEEYKLAQDEEWRARQHQLQVQAEEARQLRKRKRAEVLRLLDMEKRQKQRVEEIRESQRKDEETINLKEQLRIEVRKELQMLELKCKNMAALLRALGINVEGGPCPTTHEIRAAYKQALLRYHPDRSSKASIRQQVEGEETFKLISRLKEKLLATA